MPFHRSWCGGPLYSGATCADGLGSKTQRVFNIDIEVCARCGGSARVIVEASNRCIEDQDVIDRILAHLREKEQDAPARPLLLPPTRAPPATLSLFAGTELNQQGRH